jgi:hypothetical protein
MLWIIGIYVGIYNEVHGYPIFVSPIGLRVHCTDLTNYMEQRLLLEKLMVAQLLKATLTQQKVSLPCSKQSV